MVSHSPKTAAGAIWRAALAGLLFFLAAFLITDVAAAAPKPTVVNVKSVGKLDPGSQYIVTTTVRNPFSKRIKGKVVLTLSKDRKPGSIILGSRSTPGGLPARGAKNILAAAKVKKSVEAGKYFIVSCFKSAGSNSCGSRSASVVPSMGRSSKSGLASATGAPRFLC